MGECGRPKISIGEQMSEREEEREENVTWRGIKKDLRKVSGEERTAKKREKKRG
jgi:hypothetical protein